jgi:hypothetical protein
MKLKPLMLIMVLSLTTWTLLIQTTQAQTKIALHATQAEVDIWKQRRLSGPYADEWNSTLQRANNFRSSVQGAGSSMVYPGLWLGNRQNEGWNGAEVDSCSRLPTVYPGGSSSDCASNHARTYADGVRDAGFVYLVTGDTSYRDVVRTVLLCQAGQGSNTNCAIPWQGANFSDTTRWPLSYSRHHKDLNFSVWLRKVTYAYNLFQN